MASFTLSPIPAPLEWKNTPVEWKTDPFTIRSGGETDSFVDPVSGAAYDTAPVAFFTPPHETFILSAKVRVDFGATFDAGTLQIRERDDLWGKLCFEFSPQRRPMIVSVVTRGVSDDANSVFMPDDTVYLRLGRLPQTIAFHYSEDGRRWHLVRHFRLGKLENVRVGFSSQSPVGEGCTSVFSEISYQQGEIYDIRDGE